MFDMRDYLHGMRIMNESAIVKLQLIGILCKVPLQRVLEGLIAMLNKSRLRG